MIGPCIAHVSSDISRLGIASVGLSSELRVAGVKFLKASGVYLPRDSYVKANGCIMNRELSFRGSVPVDKSKNEKSNSGRDSEKGMWSSMLDSVASGKKLPEKNLVVLGWSATYSCQRKQ